MLATPDHSIHIMGGKVTFEETLKSVSDVKVIDATGEREVEFLQQSMSFSCPGNQCRWLSKSRSFIAIASLRDNPCALIEISCADYSVKVLDSLRE